MFLRRRQMAAASTCTPTLINPSAGPFMFLPTFLLLLAGHLKLPKTPP
jgi:hypothetical protein